VVHTPYHLADNGNLVEVGVTASTVKELSTTVAWRCEKCSRILYSDTDTDEYGFRLITAPRKMRKKSKRANKTPRSIPRS